MPDKQASPEAMRLAQTITDELFSGELEDVFPGQTLKEAMATIIDRYRQWIKCSDRMPTGEDGNNKDCVLWGALENDLADPDYRVGMWCWYDSAEEAEADDGFTHWMPLPNDPEPEDAT